MFLWAQVALRFSKALGDEMSLLKAVQTKTSTLNKDSLLSRSPVLKFVAIGQLMGGLAIHTFNWVACTSWTIPARQRKLRCQCGHSTIRSAGRRHFQISLARYLRGSACFANLSKDWIVYSNCAFLYELHQVFKARQHPSLAYPLHFISPSRLMNSRQLTGHFSEVGEVHF